MAKSPLHQCLHAARRRLFVQRLLNLLAGALCAAIGLALALMLSDRLLATHSPTWLFVVVAAVPLIVALVLSFMHRESDESVATIVDERLGLKNRLASGLYAQTLPNDPFARRVVDDAQDAAKNVRPSQAVPVTLSRWWVAVFLLLITGAFSYYLVPERDLLGFDARRKQAKEEKEESTQTAEDVKKAAEAVEELRKHDNDALSKEAQESLAELAQMTRNDLSNPALKRQAEAQISKAEDRLETETEEKQQTLDEIQNSLSKVDSGVENGPADTFEKAMRQGDYAAAAKALEQLSKAMDNMSKEDREQLFEQLTEIAKQLEEAAKKSDEQEQAKKQEEIEKELADAGLSKEQIEELEKEIGGDGKQDEKQDKKDDEKGDQNKEDEQEDKKDEKKDEKKDQPAKPKLTKEEIQKALEKKGVSSEKAKQLAEKMDNAEKAKEAEGEGEKATKELAEALKNAAEGSDGKDGKQANGGGEGKPMDGAQKQLEQMARMKESLNRMKQSNKQLRDVMNQMGKKGGGGKIGDQGKQDGDMEQQMAGEGGDGWGRGAGGHPLGEERKAMENVDTEAAGMPGDPKGKVITSWDQSGPMSKGEAKLTYDRAVTSARDQADKAIEEDRVPIKYRKTIKDYFNQVPSSPEGVTAPATP